MNTKVLACTLGGLLTMCVAAAIAQDSAPPPPDQSQAQPGPRGSRRMDPDRQLAHMTLMLDLTPDQQSKIRPILIDRQQKMATVFQDQTLSRDDRRAKMQSIRQDTQTRIEALLDDKQKQKFEAMRPMGRRGNMGGPGGPPPSPSPQPQ